MSRRRWLVNPVVHMPPTMQANSKTMPASHHSVLSLRMKQSMWTTYWTVPSPTRRRRIPSKYKELYLYVKTGKSPDGLVKEFAESLPSNLNKQNMHPIDCYSRVSYVTTTYILHMIVIYLAIWAWPIGNCSEWSVTGYATSATGHRQRPCNAYIILK